MMSVNSRPSRSLFVLIVWGLVSIAPAPARAEDTAVIQSPTQSTRVTIKGQIVDYTGQSLSIRTGPMAVLKTFPATEVVKVETEYSPAHARGLKLFGARKFTEAEAAFTEALEDEERTWVRRELLASLVKCALAEDRLRQAALRFAPLVESDPQTRHWGLVPLIWDEEAVTLPSEADARTVLLAGGRVAPLIAASWNLYRQGLKSADAESTLQALASDADVMLQRLAQMQLWRVRLRTMAVTETERRRWQTFAVDLPPSLQGGAHVLMGEAAWRQKDALQAAAEWMWLPLHHAEQPALAAWCQLRAAEALQSAGDTTSAERLRQELRIRFPQTKAALRSR